MFLIEKMSLVEAKDNLEIVEKFYAIVNNQFGNNLLIQSTAGLIDLLKQRINELENPTNEEE